ncbi:MAG: ribbon-helix-helix domain-containing protein [Halarcobacter sp.]
MHNLSSLEKQQVGLRVPKYLLDEIDEFTNKFSVNRSEVIIEAIKSYVEEQKANIFYSEFDEACIELNKTITKKSSKDNDTLEDLINELENN